jgi:hypothetical protein
LLGFARRFRPTYAGANVGHPSISFGRGYEMDYLPQRLKPQFFLLSTDGVKAVPFTDAALCFLKLRRPECPFVDAHQRETKGCGLFMYTPVSETCFW